MYSLIKNITSQDKCGHISRRLFVERFILALGICPVGLSLLRSSSLAAIPAQSESGDIGSADVKYPGDGATLQGYLSRPKGKGPFPGIIIVDRNLDLVENGRAFSRRLASQGYAALTVDLLSRQGGSSAFPTLDAASKARRNVTDDGALSDLNAAYQFMDSNSVVKKDDIAIVGFELGGQKSFLYATTNPKLKAAVIYYGSAPVDEKLAQIQCPVLELVGGKDTRIGPAVPVIQEKMKQLGKSYEAKIYPGADHGFFDDTREGYDEAAKKESWMAVLDFLKRNLS
jgi:carboxymethylenebutenolidase